ncbi:transporter substrate-binding domain-containing protein [Paucibacter sp. B2R-40]|uniref:substrate-binding periplasmic protein n=1 Tax=Paucibacter sp. B2R-40 TaxID=2893554 RepID=UPI0021E36C53|nr:transporter substrate-binding domain-containing protein [Paucibacter sp. B2R-40]MCV2355550.1 transporter substrate-binding domain-containing protein [Paucibacter sp. B2R-40]
MNFLLRRSRRPLPWLLAAALCPTLLLSHPARAAQLEWLAGELPPFVWQSQDGPHGLAYELAAQMSLRLGRPMSLTIYPWARAVRMAEGGPNYGVFPLARTLDREAKFKWLIPLAHVNYTFFGRRGSSVDLDDLEALRSQRIGVLRGSPIIKNLQAEKFRHLVQAKDYKELLRLLTEGMVAAAYAGEPMLRAAIDEFGFKPQEFRSGLSLKSAELYVATSLALDPLEEERWLQAYRELQLDGTVARLQKKYLQREH